MSVLILSEVEQYILHGDYSLGLRRIMDLALDVQSPDMIHRATALSHTFRKQIHAEAENIWVDNFRAASKEIIRELAALATERVPEPALLLLAENVTKTYRNGFFSLKPTNLALHAGQVIGVVGENGNGKTTLLRCLAGQLAIDAGVIRYAEIGKVDYYSVKSRIAFIPQRIPRWFGKLKDNLHFSAAIAGVTGARNDMMVTFMLERFGLTEYAHLTWNQISSGYRTRFEIARVLLQQPHVLILDEPLANLDIHAQQTLLTDLRFLAKSAVNKVAVVLTSQQLHEVEKAADTVMLIRQGQCIFQTGLDSVRELGYALELETPSSRENVMHALEGLETQVSFNGGYFTIVSKNHDVQAIMKKLVNAGIRINYCRDISESTKRLF
jgi:ABC-2 type transport system ATP-binding protein